MFLCFLCIVALSLTMGLALSSLMVRSVTEWEWENTATLVRLAVTQAGGPHALFTDPREGRRRWKELSGFFIGLPEVVRLKVWDREATVLWSDEARLIGQRFPDNRELRAALAGRVSVEIKELTKPEHAFERGRFATLAEVYVPIFSDDTSREVLGVVEIYKTPIRLFAALWWGRIVILTISLAGGLSLSLLLLLLVRQSKREQARQIQGMTSLLEISKASSSTLDLPQLLKVVAQKTA
jgi:hypothetical protein